MAKSDTPVDISVAIACFNQARYLGDAIRSILSQTYPVKEIILVDDGSTDDTAAVAKDFPSVVYHYQKNGGLSSARNTGLMLTSTDRVLFLDADDILMPNAIADGMNCFDDHPAAAFVYGGYREVTESRELIFEARARAHPDGFTGLLLWGNHVSMHGTVIYNAGLLKASGGFDTTLASCEDYDVLLRLARNHTIAAYDSIGAEYRRHSGNMTYNHIRMMELSRFVIRRHVSAGPPLTSDQLQAARIGLEVMTGFYARNALREISLGMRRVASLTYGGMRNDPRFAIRAISYAFRIVLRRLVAKTPRDDHESETDSR